VLQGARARAPPQSALGFSERKSRLRELPERQRHTVRYRRGIYSVSLPVKRGLGPPGTRKLATKEREDHELRLMTVATGTQFEVANALSVQNKPTKEKKRKKEKSSRTRNRELNFSFVIVYRAFPRTPKNQAPMSVQPLQLTAPPASRIQKIQKVRVEKC